MYILSEFTLLIIILIGIFNFNNDILNIIKFIPIFINLIVSFNRKVDINLRLGIISTIIADVFFLLFDIHLYGVLFFFIGQIFYYLYLNNSKNKFIYFLMFLNIIGVLIFKNMIIEACFYGLLEIINIYKCHKLSRKDKKINKFKYGLILLLLCDITIGLRQLFTLDNNIKLILDASEWLFYIPSQILVVLYIDSNKKIKKYILKKYSDIK